LKNPFKREEKPPQEPNFATRVMKKAHEELALEEQDNAAINTIEDVIKGVETFFDNVLTKGRNWLEELQAKIDAQQLKLAEEKRKESQNS